MASQLSGVAIIICIAIGFTTFILIFIFGKRQIMRFALKSRRGPHIPIAADAPKHLRKEIDRRFEIVKEIKFEPKLVDDELLPEQVAANNDDGKHFDHIFRMKSVDKLTELQQAIIDAKPGVEPRPPGQDLRFFLHRMARDGQPLSGCDSSLINEFVDIYSHARHEPTPVFTEIDYKRYMDLLTKLISHVRGKSDGAPPLSKPSSPQQQSNTKSTSVALNGRTTVRIITPDGGELDESSV